MSVSVLGGLLFSYSTSRVRTEMECLDKVLAAWRETPKVTVIQSPVIPPTQPVLSAPAATPPAASDEVKKPEAAKAPAKKASAPKKPAAKASTAPSCEEAALKACRPAKTS